MTLPIKLSFTISFCILLFCGVCANVQAQKTLKEAEKQYHNFNYSLALELYKKVLQEQEPKLEVVQRIADSYRLMNNSKEAEFWYGQVFSFPNADPANLFIYAESAKRNGNYEKARQLFKEYGQKMPAHAALAQKMAASCDTALRWMQAPQPFKVASVEVLNSKGADFSPVRMKDGLLISSDRLQKSTKDEKARYGWTGNGYVQLYRAPAITDSTFGAPVVLPSAINTEFHNGPASFLEKEQILYFTRTHSVKKGAGKANTDPTSWFKGADAGIYTNRHGIFMSERKGDKWQKAIPFAYNKLHEYSVGHPAVTPDGKVLYFVSDKPGGFGETDIYFCERKPDGSWGAPVNAGNIINTAGRESFPGIGDDGKLYFSSDGHTGMGGLDVFRAIGKHNNWTAVENLKYPLNTSYDDFGIVMDSTGAKGLISSGRESTDGFDNIFSFKEDRVPCTLQGKTVERLAIAGTSKRKEVPVEGVRLQLYVEGSDVPEEIYSDKMGRFNFKVNAGLNYTIRGTKPKYLTQTVAMVTECRFDTDSVKVEMIFNRDTPNKPIVLDNIFYDLDKATIRPDAARELDKLVRTLNDNPSIRIELSSHTDSRQSHRYNEMLSQLRAQAAVDYLISKGIDRNRLVAKGYGETKLINKCKDDVYCTESQHQENRRTEFKILN